MKTLKVPVKNLLKVSSFTVAIVLLPFAALALDIKDIPNPRQINGTWVTDMAGILDAPTESQINSIITQLEQKNGAEIAVVTVPETSPSVSPKAFATTLFNYWKIGKKGQNNGILLLISKGDRRVEIETGYGIEPILPNAEVSNIIDSKITPKFKQADFNGGTLAGTQALIVALEKPIVSNQSAPLPITTNIQEIPSSIIPNTSIRVTQPLILEEPSQNKNAPWGLLAASSLITAIGTIVYKYKRVKIEPEGESRFKGGSRKCFCATCKKKMEKVDDSIVQATLTKAEKVAQQIGSLKFEGWKCPQCSQQLTGLGFHRVSYQPRFSQFSECPTCQELTVKHTVQILQHPTESSTGKRLITYECHCCDYYTQIEQTIPRLPPPPPPSSNSSNSIGSSSSSSGGSDFGGGSSGGGGAGGSW
ncbi:MAG: TPM domain-containing protein [Coleofasciculaceae cyanobacterium]